MRSWPGYRIRNRNVKDVYKRQVLTSGQKNSAWEGRELLKQLVEKSGGRIEILHGAGITPEILEKLALYTGGCAFHLSGKIVKDSRMEYRRHGISMGFPGFSEWEIWETSADNIRRACETLAIMAHNNPPVSYTHLKAGVLIR